MTKIVNADLNIEAGDLEAELEAIRAEEATAASMRARGEAYRKAYDAETARLLSLRGTDGTPLYIPGGPTGARLALV